MNIDVSPTRKAAVMIDTDQEAFDVALFHAVMRRAAASGSSRVSLVDPALTARLPVCAVTSRFPSNPLVLTRLA